MSIVNIANCVFHVTPAHRTDFEYLSEVPILTLDVNDDFKANSSKGGDMIEKVRLWNLLLKMTSEYPNTGFSSCFMFQTVLSYSVKSFSLCEPVRYNMCHHSFWENRKIHIVNDENSTKYFFVCTMTDAHQRSRSLSPACSQNSKSALVA